MGLFSANSNRDHLWNDPLPCFEPPKKARDEIPPVGMEKGGALLSALSSVSDFPFAGAPNNLDNRKGDDRPEPVTTPRPGTTGDGDLGRIRTVICGLEDPPPVRRLPRAATLPPIPGLPPVDPPTAVRDRGWIEPQERMSSPLLGRPSNSLSSLTKFLIAGAIMTPLVGYLVFASSRQQMNIPTAPQPTIDISPIASLPFEQVVYSSGGANDGAEPEFQTTSLQPAVRLNIKPSDSDIDATSPQAMPGTEQSATSAETRPILGSSLGRQASVGNSADAVLDAQDTKPLMERGGQVVAASVHTSSCFPSASAVREDQPGAWPSWTLRAPGHEGTKCWYAATRATARDHRSEMMPKETVGTTETLGSPGETNGLICGTRDRDDTGCHAATRSR